MSSKAFRMPLLALLAVPVRAAQPIVFDVRSSPTAAVSTPTQAHAINAPSELKARATQRTRLASRQGDVRAIEGRIGTVVSSNTRIYDGPYRQRVFNVVQPGQSVILTGYNSQWFGVRMIDGRTGWVWRGAVQLMDVTVRIPEIVSRPSTPGQTAPGTTVQGVRPLLQTAFRYMGIPYRWGGTSSNGIDCSGFVLSVFRQHGVPLPRTAREQAGVGTPVAFNDLQPGDRLYFACHHRYIDHTGIYWGNGLFIHSSGGRGVDVTPLWGMPIYRNGLVAARRTPWLAG